MSHKYDHMRKLLHDACMLKAIEDLKAFPPDEEIAKMHEFSPEFLRNMEKMMDEVFNKKKKPDAAAIKRRRIEKFKKYPPRQPYQLHLPFPALCRLLLSERRL